MSGRRCRIASSAGDRAEGQGVALNQRVLLAQQHRSTDSPSRPALHCAMHRCNTSLQPAPCSRTTPCLQACPQGALPTRVNITLPGTGYTLLTVPSIINAQAWEEWSVAQALLVELPQVSVRTRGH